MHKSRSPGRPSSYAFTVTHIVCVSSVWNLLSVPLSGFKFWYDSYIFGKFVDLSNNSLPHLWLKFCRGPWGARRQDGLSASNLLGYGHYRPDGVGVSPTLRLRIWTEPISEILSSWKRRRLTESLRIRIVTGIHTIRILYNCCNEPLQYWLFAQFDSEYCSLMCIPHSCAINSSTYTETAVTVIKITSHVTS